MTTPTRSRTTVLSSGLIVMNASLPSVRPYGFIGDGSTGTVTIPEFVKNSVRLFVNGQAWSPDWFAEGQDNDDLWTKIIPVYPLELNTPCWVEYKPVSY